MEGTLKRLYVGGIGPSVTRAELTERFGKFGKVADVDIISRKDDEGNPIKTFAYINIAVSDADLKKCMSLLNKTKWKGGVIQIEMAKESFLHRLSQERQKAKEKEEAKSRRKSQSDLVQSLEKAGVTDFQMKSAVPGTEVPNHKNWVVSKFGRVLPVLHLNGNKQSKSMKYDPSKFCHNIKKIDDDDSFETVPVSKLTWQLEGGNDEISKKRRGEFPAFKSPPKKASKYLDKGNVSNTKMSTRVPSAFIPQSEYESQNARKPQQTKIRGHLLTKTINSMSDEEYDSEEELQAVLQRERAIMGSFNHADDSNVEVVDDSFELSYTTHWGKRDAKALKPNLSTQDDKEYDSADTDEIITVAKTTQDDCRSDKKKKATVVKNENSSLKVHNKKQASTVVLSAKSLHKPKVTVLESESGSKSSASEAKSNDSISDEEYDSEEELQAVLQRESARMGSVDHAEDSNVEVVDDSFELSYTTHWGKRDAKAQKPDLSAQDGKEYDSADTDEIITVAKTTQDDCRSDKKKKATIVKTDNSSLQVHKKKSTVGPGAKSLHEPKATVLESESDSESSASEAESSDSFSDEEYEAMMQNCYRLDLTMGDLEAMSKKTADRDSDDVSEDEYESESDAPNISHFTNRASPKPVTSNLNNSAKEQKPINKLISETVKGKQKAKTLHQGKLDSPSEKVETDKSDPDLCQQKDSAKQKPCGDNGKIKLLKAKSSTPKPSLVKNRKLEDVSEDEEAEEIGKKYNPGSQKIKKVIKKRGIEPDDTVASILEDSDSGGEEGKPKGSPGKPSLVKDRMEENISEDEKAEDNKKKEDSLVKKTTKKRGIEPDDIVASILEDGDSDDERPKRKKGPPLNLPAFKGLGSLMASSLISSSLSSKFCGQVAAISEANNKRTSGDTKKGGAEEPCRDLRKTLPEAKQESTSSSDTSSDDDSSTDSSPTTSPAGKSCATPTVPAKGQPPSEGKQKKDNQKRLAAMEERRKERELQKQTIQGALLKLDSQASKKSQHITFSSDSGTESEKEEEEPTSETEVLPNDSKAKQGGTKLLDSSEEDSGSEDEEDDGRFEIKAQYEGRSGEKLMQLQSRFGADERFKMDSRFLESGSDDEEASEEAQKSPREDDLSAEKKKNLSILQSIMNVKVEPRPTSKRAEKAKKFKDLNALHYDPTKEDHEEFETKVEEKKESKSERKKKRLEAEKLPEVSKDTYHEINVDLKEVFSTFKPQGVEEAEATWDQQLEPEKMEEDTSDKNFSFLNQAEEPEGFTFSFFGNNEEENVPSNEPYKTETIKPAKVAWQEDPRFQDSSSGEDEEEDGASMAAEEKPSAQPATSSLRFFFFVKDDERLKTGPKTFCWSSNTEPEDWEWRRDSLLEECRKRHKDAKRKMKTKH